jgi:signal transduction histidine kinase
MADDYQKFLILEPPKPIIIGWHYYVVGVLIGILLGVVIGHPLFIISLNIHDFLYVQKPLSLGQAIIEAFYPDMWPTMLLYAISGGIFGGFCGWLYSRLKEKRMRLQFLNEEFQLQIAAIRHHYKNLTIGIQGFSNRIKRKLGKLDDSLGQCKEKEWCEGYRQYQGDFGNLKDNVAILENTAQSLTDTLGKELMYLRALTQTSLPREPQDLYPFLINSVKSLLELRFRDKDIKVEINFRPMEVCQDSLTFFFESYSMEVILQNILSNAMKYGDYIRIQVKDLDSWVAIEIQDNGPGLEMQKLKEHLIIPLARQETSSTHLGLETTLHLLDKYGGQLLVSSELGHGACFVIKMPKQL